MEKPAKDAFDPKSFLAKVGAGKTVLEFHKNQHVFIEVHSSLLSAVLHEKPQLKED